MLISLIASILLASSPSVKGEPWKEKAIKAITQNSKTTSVVLEQAHGQSGRTMHIRNLSVALGTDAKSAAEQFVKDFGAVFAPIAGAEMVLSRSETAKGLVRHRFKFYISGLQIWPGEVSALVSQSGELRSISVAISRCERYKGLFILAPMEAAETAAATCTGYGFPTGACQYEKVEKILYQTMNGTCIPSYRILFQPYLLEQRWEMVVDAGDGQVIVMRNLLLH